jgi:hypothetical protein
MMSHIAGRKLSEFAPYLTASERSSIDQTLGVHVRALTTLSATQFGTTHRVFAKKGSNSWREAFLALLEAIIRDAEDMLVNTHSESIRFWVGKHAQCLEDVIEPRLVALSVLSRSLVWLVSQTSSGAIR